MSKKFGGNGGGGKPTKYQQQMKGKGYSSSKQQGQTIRAYGRQESSQRTALRLEGDEIDKKFGFDRMTEGEPRLGWLLNFLPISMADESGTEKSGLDLYFLDREGENFKASIFYEPYFYLVVSDHRRVNEITQHLQKRFEACRIAPIKKEDLEMANHLSGRLHTMLKLSFSTVSELMDAKMQLNPIIKANQKRNKVQEEYYQDEDTEKIQKASDNPLSFISDMREYDVPYPMRVAIDTEIRVGGWHIVTPIQDSQVCTVVRQQEMLELCQPNVLAFDIECEKSPLKFPNADVDRIFMISYMFQGQGYLLTNREIVSADVDDFEYTQLAKFPGPFEVINLADEEALLRKFLSHVQELRPHVIVTYNGDFFDWPYVDQRCQKFEGMSLYKELGIRATSGTGEVGEGEYTGRTMVHLDAFAWVRRDSYLPQGSQGLKAVTRYKLGYDPIEVDPEDMVKFAQEKPEYMAAYSVSDAVATFYLYTTYVHNFIFSMSTVIPLAPEDVLRKGSGTLCEALLMVEAYRGNIICPNKQNDPIESFTGDGHLLESETYIGGHVECLEAGVFRADFPNKFNLTPSAFQQLINNIDRDLAFALETENGVQRSDIVNYDEVRQGIVEQLEMLRDSPVREEEPIIIHIDVGAMYPNIILTNRLQPGAIVSQSDCAACDFNHEENGCKRPMKWTWRGDYTPCSGSDYSSVKARLAYQHNGFADLSERDQSTLLRKSLKTYAQTAYKKVKITKEEERVDTVCQRENPFYVNTVRAFRDRRYDYKLLTKQYKGQKIEAEKKGNAVERKNAEDKEVLMDSLQLAHKCILNSFYGYVMRKGARWRSMEMAGIVTRTGADLIMQARELVEQIGRPLELDTDGIWCILPSSFPQEFKMVTKAGKKVTIEYPAAMLNADVHERYTNHQYQDLATGGGQRKYKSKSECSIYFELDGPYKAMILPASPEEGKLLKKKYAVYNFDGTIAELKGFEIKRRGELELVKIFQQRVFENFLEGDSLQTCYDAVGEVGNEWLDILDNKGVNINDDELLGYISERKTISKTVDEYDGKSTSLTTAGRLADFLGPEMLKDKGLNCNLLISRLPAGAPTTERAIPIAIFSAEPSVRRHFLRKWLKDPGLDVDDFRNVVDWDYYKQRLGNSLQKIITIPAGIQRVPNPCPRIEHPTWLQRTMADQATGLKQATLTSMFSKISTKDKDNSLVEAKLVSNALSSSPIKSPLKQRDRGHDVTGSGATSLMFSPAGKSRGPFHNSPSLSERKRKGGEDLFSASPSPGGGATRDIEDLYTSPSGTIRTRPVVHQRKSSSSAASANGLFGGEEKEHNEGEKAVDVEDNFSVRAMRDGVPESDEDLQQWLAARKNTWKAKLLQKRKEKSKDNNSRSDYAAYNEQQGARKKPLGVVEMARGAAMAASFGYWQILELQETDSPGEFVVWAMTNRTQLQRLRVVIPRIIYVNVNGKKAADVARKLGGVSARRDLPHGRPLHNLFEVQLSERKFQRNEKALSNFLADPNVEGVYEGQVPLWLRGVLRLGCVARVTKADAKNANQNRPYKLDELEYVSVAAHPYLQPNTALFRRIYIYHCEDQSRKSGLGAIGLFIVESNNAEEELTPDTALSARAFVWLADGGSNQDARPPMQRLYRTFQEDDRANVKFVTLAVNTLKDAFKACNDRLDSYLRERNGPTIVVAQGAMAAKIWRSYIPVLRQLPLSVMPSNADDNYFPGLQWQMFVAKRMIQRFLIFPRWFADRLECSRYAHIPLCNLGPDSLTSIIDISFSRQLVHNRHLLWASNDPFPDIGGAEADLQAAFSETLSEPVVSNMGAYRGVCVELEIYGLDVCAIMSSDELDAQGLTVVGNEKAQDDGEVGGSAIFSDSSCARAFLLLKAIVTKWIEDIRVREDKISDSITVALYRYLCGFGNALLYDPAIHRLVYGLKTKLFRRIVGEFHKLGASIVFANFSRIIISTNKTDLRSATEYVNYLVSAIGLKDTFSYVDLTVNEYYEQLLWLGPENFGAVSLTEESEQEKWKMFAGTGDETAELGSDSGDEQRGADAEEGEGEGLAEMKNGLQDSPVDKKTIRFSEEVEYSDAPKLDKYGYEIDEDEAEEEHKSRGGAGQGGEDQFWADLNGTDDQEQDKDDHAEEAHVAEDEIEEEEGMKASWNLASYLPHAAGVYFHHVISEYLRQYQKRFMIFTLQKEKHLEQVDALELESAEHVTEGADGEKEKGKAAEKYTGPVDDEGVKDATIESMKSLVNRLIASKMLEYVDDLNSDFPGHDQQKYFPEKAGSHLQFGSVALEFVKATTHVLALDQNMSEEVSSLRRMLLSHLKVREFNADSKFKDPSLSYVLSDVICSYCGTGRDLDLLRDQNLTTNKVDMVKGRSKEEDEKNLREGRWKCQHCRNNLDLVEVENRLLEEIHRLSTSYLLQDARCSATKAVSVRMCTAESDLSAPLVLDTTPAQFKVQMEKMRRVAEFHKFEYLARAINELN